MPDFTLPSGRVVEMKLEPTYGDECRAVFAGLRDSEEYHWAKLTTLCPGLTRADIEAMDRDDGGALAQEVNKRFVGRAVADEIPFENKSSSLSTDSPVSPDQQPNESPNSDYVGASGGVTAN